MVGAGVLYLAGAGPAYRYASPEGCFAELYAPLNWLNWTTPTLREPYRTYLALWSREEEEVIETLPPPQEILISTPQSN
jgi:hypothetical protein